MSNILFRVKKFYIPTLANNTYLEDFFPPTVNQEIISKTAHFKHITIRLARNEKPKESQIKKIKYKGQDAGYIIPGPALLPQANIETSNKLLGAILIHTLNKIITEAHSLSKEGCAIPDASQLINENYHYLTVRADLFDGCDNAVSRFLQEFYGSLVLDGYFLARQDFYKLISHNHDLPHHFFPEYESGSLHLKKCKKSAFLADITLKTLPYEKNIFFAFYQCWQLVENIMNEIFISRINDFIGTFQPTTDYTASKSAIDKLNELTKEQTKINIIFNGMHTELDIAINDLYQKIKRDEKKYKTEEKLYKIRNICFHGLEHIIEHEREMQNLMQHLFPFVVGKLLPD